MSNEPNTNEKPDTFVFPDEREEKDQIEVEVKTGETSDVEIEVVDDTPEEDQKHVARHVTKSAPPADVTDEELDKYTDVRLKDRLQRLGRGMHDERRAKEAAIREREEAVRYTQSVLEENKRLQSTLATNQTALINQAKKAVEADVTAAKQAYRTAFDSGDTDAVIAAQELLTNAKIKADKINNFKPPPLQTPQNTVQPEQRAPEVDTKTREWQEQNPWFGSNQKMTAYALGLHQELVDSGVKVSSDAYFDTINADIKKRFPETFEEEPAEAKISQRPKTNVVAPVSRSTAPKKIVLTKSQEMLARRLGIPLEAYARSVMDVNRRKA